jgi:hypothetical protein
VEASRNRGFSTAWARDAFALDLRSLAAYRIALGGVLVADCLLRTRDFRLMHTATGMFTPDAVREYAGRATCWSAALLSDSDAWAAAILALEGVAGLLLAVGCVTRLATILAWVAVVSIVRRTAPATNAGDSWLACQLFWACFVPLGAVWSCDALRRGGEPGPRPQCAWSAGTAALVVQLALVYLSAGIGKCNDTWWSGAALGHALSVHDHGTHLGMALSDADRIVRPLTRLVPPFEIAGALLVLAVPMASVRGVLVTVFASFHLVIWGAMSVGLFAPIAIAAWLPLVPSAWWDRGRRVAGEGVCLGLGRGATAACAAALTLAVVGWTAALLRPATTNDRPRLPPAIEALLDLTALHQEWLMFADVRAQRQWVVSRAVLADGRVVDLVRGGAPFETAEPAGGFMSLPHHRWHKLFWVLHEPRMRCFAPGVAAGLVRAWNANHAAAEQVRSLEIRFGKRSLAPDDETLHELVVAAWPPRSVGGAGGLERLLDEASAGRRDGFPGVE